MLAQRLAHAILVKMEDAGDSPDDRVQDAVARSREVKRYVDQLWPAVDPARLVLRLLADPDVAGGRPPTGCSTDEEQARLLWAKPFKAPASARWSLADAVLIDEAADLVERTPSLGHVVADEAQDLSPMMLRAVGRRCSTGSTTVLGDLAQATTPWASRSWEDALRPPRQAGRARRAAHQGVPGPGRGDRVRRPAAADDRARAWSRPRRCGARAASSRWSGSRTTGSSTG